MIDADFIEKFAEVCERPTLVLTVNGKEYVTKTVLNVPLPEEPVVQPLKVSTLQGFAEFIKAQPGADRLVHIVNPGHVSLVGPVAGEHKRRDTFCDAIAIAPYKAFQFGTYYDAETFNVLMQTLFEQSGDWSRLMKIVGTIRDEKVQTSTDNGVTQTVAARAGIAVDEAANVPNPVILTPFRTFPEVAQPPSKFTLRLQPSKPGSQPMAALFEADGGAWKLEAISSIRTFLSAATDLPIIS